MIFRNNKVFIPICFVPVLKKTDMVKFCPHAADQGAEGTLHQSLPRTLAIDDPSFMSRIITCDKTWVYWYNPEK